MLVAVVSGLALIFVDRALVAVAVFVLAAFDLAAVVADRALAVFALPARRSACSFPPPTGR